MCAWDSAKNFYKVKLLKGAPPENLSAHDRRAWNALLGIFEADTFTYAQGLRTIATLLKVGDIEADVTFERLVQAGYITTTEEYHAYEYSGG